jgi:hypothetical protein
LVVQVEQAVSHGGRSLPPHQPASVVPTAQLCPRSGCAPRGRRQPLSIGTEMDWSSRARMDAKSDPRQCGPCHAGTELNVSGRGLDWYETSRDGGRSKQPPPRQPARPGQKAEPRRGPSDGDRESGTGCLRHDPDLCGRTALAPAVDSREDSNRVRQPGRRRGVVPDIERLLVGGRYAHGLKSGKHVWQRPRARVHQSDSRVGSDHGLGAVDVPDQ